MKKKNLRSKKFLNVALTASVATGAVVSLAPTASADSVFKDIKEGDHFYEAVLNLHERQIVQGFGNEFKPYAHVTRAQAAKVIALALELDVKNVKDPMFNDVAKTDWAYSYIAALANKGIVSGYGDEFRPNAPLSRAQMAKMITLAFEFKKEASTELPFTDVNSGDWYAEFLTPLVKNKVTTGTTPTTFSPNGHVTRGQMASFVFRSEKVEVVPENYSLTIMHTNDTHGNVERIPRRITAVNQIREEKPNSLLLDAGDVFSGTLYFNEFEGQADLELMNMLNYDAMTLGNHEFDLGTGPLGKFVKNAKFPFVSTNLDLSKSADLKERFTTEYTSKPEDGMLYSGIVKEVAGEKVGIFGLTTAETKEISSPGEDVVFEDYIEEAKKAVAEFESQGINKIVAVTHIGFQDGGGDNDVTLAKEVAGIDVIVGGHSHDTLDKPYVSTTREEPTVIVQANEYGKYLGVLDVEFDENGKVITHEGNLIDINKKENDQYVLAEDPAALKVLNEKYKPAIDAAKAKVVGKTDVVLDGVRENVRTKETNLGNLITDGMLAKAKTINPNTVIAVQNGGGIRASINEGDITQEEVLTVLPFGNSLALMQLTGAEIKAAFEHSVKEAPTPSGAFLHVSGMKFVYDSSKPAGERVQTIEVKEGDKYVALDETKTYVVATNVFTAKGGDGYTMFKKAYEEGRVSEPGFVDWEMFVTHLNSNSTIPTVEGRIVDAAAQN
ncbi:5'-nucleotidase C-terminal domain-containing protein [Metabacillus iocasae]|uniref:2',3'-cyclic-nucleotide 2'-phosphodiesterase/3'-nucleotidase/5'-nucleotidase n=1 Tax=Priestia iocasae TaxID=2291674 RepID=A0ABS2QSU7_9BACI|nr:5'-nucleotidase C-terminal domain-containing protein [Metabacillus iocasae]MBM7702509.1 2',3'-cyclic-nucleotide 2'-phosphodiesterase/3'-nucleotidase/5'-nucleotidase [Metabacillus iocasae]